jgi:hypothetical protein
MWTKSDVLALLQLLAMIIFATVHAAWCLAIHRGAHFPLTRKRVLTSLELLLDGARVIKSDMEMVAEAKHSRTSDCFSKRCSIEARPPAT